MTTPATDWGPYGLADIWDMVRDDNFDNFSHVRAWEKMRVLCHGMADSLKAAAAELAQRWPPEQSPAAEAFKEKLELLALTFSDAGDAAGTNGPTLAEVNGTFAGSHGRIAQLCRSWEQMERDEAARVTIARRVLGVGSIPIIGMLPVALPVVNGMSDRQVLAVSNTQPARFVVDQAGAPTVPTDWRQNLDSQARGVMAANDREIVDAGSRIQPSPILHPIEDVTELAAAQGGGPTGGGFVKTSVGPPSIPHFPTGNPERPPTLDGAVLSGGTPAAGPGSGPNSPFPSTAGGAPVQPGGGSVPWVMTPAGPAMASGGVIGERTPGPRGSLGPNGAGPGGIVPMASQPTRPAGAAAGRGFVAPPGGLIGGVPPGRPSAPNSGVARGSMRRQRGKDEESDWVVPSGVPGVLQPDPEPEMHDPGPGVLGIDR